MFLGFVSGKCFTRLAFCRLGGALRGEGLAGLTDFSTVMFSHCIHLLRLTFRRTRVVAVAIRGLDVTFTGRGTVRRQSIMAGQAIRPEQKVTIELR